MAVRVVFSDDSPMAMEVFPTADDFQVHDDGDLAISQDSTTFAIVARGMWVYVALQDAP